MTNSINTLDTHSDQPAPQPWRYFPIAPDTKRPALPGDWRAHATDDRAQIDAWLGAGFGIALDCGASGVTVIDLDPPCGVESWAALQAEHGEAPPTYTKRTPRGGLHLYFQGAAPNSVCKLANKVDTRGPGGYVVFDDGRGGYELIHDHPLAALPAWIAPRLAVAGAKAAAAQADIELDLPANVRRAIEWLESQPPVQEGDGADARTLQAANALFDLGLSEETAVAVMIEHFKCFPQDDRFEAFIARKVENALAYRQNDVGAWALARDPAERFAAVVDAGPLASPVRFKLSSLREVRARPPITWLLPGMLPEASLVEIFGFPQAGKTWLGLDLALHLATGHPGYSRERSPAVDVIYFCGEGATNFAQMRATAWCKDRGYDPDDDTAIRLHILELAPNLRNDAELQKLSDDINAQGVRPKAIFLDTLARVLAASGWDEITKDLGEFIDRAEKIKRGFGCTVVMLHHTPVDDDSRPRGGGALNAGIGAEFRLRGNVSKHTLNANRAVISAVCTKMQDGERDETPRYWRARRVHEGLVLDPITAAEGEALQRQRDEPVDILKSQIDEAFAAILAVAPDTSEVLGPHLGDSWIEADERTKVAAGGYTHRTPEQMKVEAQRWVKHALNAAAAKDGPDGRRILHEFLVMEPNGQPKRGRRGEFVFHPGAAPDRKALDTGL